MPDEDRHLARGRDRSDLMAASRPDAQEEGVLRTGCLGRRPGGLDQQRLCVRPADLANPPMLGQAEPGLPTRGLSPK
jgi:hypothetical protein